MWWVGRVHQTLLVTRAVEAGIAVRAGSFLRKRRPAREVLEMMYDLVIVARPRARPPVGRRPLRVTSIAQEGERALHAATLRAPIENIGQ
jgi:hypothetical protein